MPDDPSIALATLVGMGDRQQQPTGYPDIAGPGAPGIYGLNAGADMFGGTVGMGANPDFNAIAGPGANAVMGVNAGANGFGGTVGMGALSGQQQPTGYPSIAGPTAMGQTIGMAPNLPAPGGGYPNIAGPGAMGAPPPQSQPSSLYEMLMQRMQRGF